MPKSLILAYPLVHKELPPASAELVAALAASETMFTPEAVRQIKPRGHYPATGPS